MFEETDFFTESIEYLVDVVHELASQRQYAEAEVIAQRIRELEQV